MIEVSELFDRTIIFREYCGVTTSVKLSNWTIYILAVFELYPDHSGRIGGPFHQISGLSAFVTTELRMNRNKIWLQELTPTCRSFSYFPSQLRTVFDMHWIWKFAERWSLDCALKFEFTHEIAKTPTVSCAPRAPVSMRLFCFLKTPYAFNSMSLILNDATLHSSSSLFLTA